MWTIDSLCVSSNSSACANEALANAANGAAVRSPDPHTRLGPSPAIARTAARTERPSAVPDPAIDRPMTSSSRSFVVSTTSAGRSSKVRRAVHAATSVASAGPA